MKPKKPKKKEVTMWAIWDPFFSSFLLDTFSTHMTKAWNLFFCDPRNSQFKEKKISEKFGFRAVKGKFVWEEK